MHDNAPKHDSKPATRGSNANGTTWQEAQSYLDMHTNYWDNLDDSPDPQKATTTRNQYTKARTQ